MAIVRKSVLEDADKLAPNLREIDREECLAVGNSPLEVLRYGIQTSEKCWTAEDGDGNIVGIFGAKILDENCCIAWLLTSEEFFKHVVHFARDSKAYIAEMKTLRPYLTNMVDVRNYKSLRWLQWCGLEIIKYYPKWGNTQLPHFQIAG